MYGAGTGMAQVGGIGGSNLLCISPTVTPKVCHDFSGNTLLTIRDMTFSSGTSDPEAGLVNVLLARISNTFFGIINKFDNVVFRSWGGPTHYGVVDYGAEQSSFIDCIFNSNLDTAKGFYISSSNTPGFTSPSRGALQTPPTSMTVTSFTGSKTQFSSNGTNAFTIDGPIVDLTMVGVYVRLNAPTDCFVADTSATSQCNDCNFIGTRLEPDAPGDTATPASQFMNLAGSLNLSSVIGGVMGWAALVTIPTQPIFKAKTMTGDSFSGFGSTVNVNPEVVITTTSTNNYFGNLNNAFISAPLTDNGLVNTFSGIVTAKTFMGASTPTLSGGGTLNAGSNSFAGTIGNIAATGNVLTPGFTCIHYPVMDFNDISTGAVIVLTGRNTTSVTFAGTATHEVDYSGATCN
jgi:hypothetical protein